VLTLIVVDMYILMWQWLPAHMNVEKNSVKSSTCAKKLGIGDGDGTEGIPSEKGSPSITPHVDPTSLPVSDINRGSKEWKAKTR
jgi:hypothetical protein